MAEPVICPDERTLRDLAEGAIGADRRDPLWAHVELCQSCQNALAALTEHDAFADLLRRSAAEATLWPVQRDAVDRLVHVGENLWSSVNMAAPGTVATSDLAADARAATPLAPGVVVGARPGSSDRYEIVKAHAEGGMGQVWIVRDKTLGRNIALKQLKPELARRQDHAARFILEAKITSRLEHPSIVPVYEVAENPETRQPFYTMRLIQGRTLTEAIRAYHADRRHGSAQAVELIRLLNAFVSVCQAIAYAHARGVIHRDLKSQNIVLGDFGEVMVLDWGLAKVVGEPDAEPNAAGMSDMGATLANSLDGDIKGTPGYMAPEQAAGEIAKITEATDVYGLGAILYEILTGRAPFALEDSPGSQEAQRRKEVLALLARIRHEAPVAPRRYWADAPAALEAVCLKTLAKKPEDRYAQVAALANDVQRWLADEPINVYREPWNARLGRVMRKHRTLTATLGVMLAALVVVLGVLLAWQRAEFRGQRAALLYSADAKKDVAQRWSAANFGQPGAFAEVHKHTKAKLDELPVEKEYAEIRQWLIDRRDIAQKLATAQDAFLLDANNTWSFIGEERAGEAKRACERALGCFGVLESDSWWTGPLVTELTSEQRKVLQRDTYRLLLMLSAMHVQQGLDSFTKAKTKNKEASATALAILAKAEAMENAKLAPASTTRTYVDKWSRKLAELTIPELLLAVNFPGAPKPFTIPDTFTPEPDYFFLGFMHRFLGTHKKDDVARVIQYLGPRDFDFINPFETGELLLRKAAIHDSEDYWTWFILGRLQMEKGDHASAQTAFERCLSLRPDYSRGHEHRGLVLVQRALAAAKRPVREAFLRQAEKDSQTAARLAPHDFSTYWVRGDMAVLLGNDDDAIDAYAHALLLVTDLHARVSLRGNRINEIDKLAKRVLARKPGDIAAESLQALFKLAKAEKANEIAQVSASLDKLSRGAPDRLLARLCHAHALELLAENVVEEIHRKHCESALLAFQTALDTAAKDKNQRWMHVEALKGKVRVLHRLERRADAENAWTEARRLDPDLPERLPEVANDS